MHTDKSELDLICFLEVIQANSYSDFTKIGIYQFVLRFIVENWSCVDRKEVGLAKCFGYTGAAHFLVTSLIKIYTNNWIDISARSGRK